jgi:F0F1-type ATP synthase membrane subunit c/vacuolar-type H+-ATPase subunit K
MPGPVVAFGAELAQGLAFEDAAVALLRNPEFQAQVEVLVLLLVNT